MLSVGQVACRQIYLFFFFFSCVLVVNRSTSANTLRACDLAAGSPKSLGHSDSKVHCEQDVGSGGSHRAPPRISHLICVTH